MGPSGLVSVDDTEVLELCQKGFKEHPDQSAVVELGGRDYRNENHMVTETAIRGMYKFYREIMQF
jgi:salicylate 5-hydroxylase large subunit